MIHDKEKNEAVLLTTGRRVSMSALPPSNSELTPPERREIAEYMIAQWAGWCDAKDFSVDGCSFLFVKDPPMPDDGGVIFRPRHDLDAEKRR